MTVSMLKTHITIAFHQLPSGSYLRLDTPYEVDSLDKRDIHLHNVLTGEPICQSICSMRQNHFHLS